MKMVNTRLNGQGNQVNDNTQINELRDMMQTLVRAVATKQQLLQQHLQSLQPQQARDQHSDGGENQQQGETSKYRKETKDQALLTENISIVRQFLKLKPPNVQRWNGSLKANEWLVELDNFF